MDPEVSARFERIETNLDRLTSVVTTLAEVAVSHEERLDRLTASQAKTDQQMKETDERMGVLIRMMDEWIRNNPRDGRTQ